MSAGAEPTEEQIKAYEEQLSRITCIDIALQAAASLVNIGGRRLGLAGNGSDERDLEQVRDAIDGVRGLMPVLERRLRVEETRPLRDALAQLQMAYAKLVSESSPGPAASSGAQTQGPNGAASEGESGPAQGGQGPRPQPPQPGQAPGDAAQRQKGPGPAEASGRLWVPGSR